MVNGESFNIYQGRIGSSVTELQRLEFYVSRMRNLVICYFVFKNQSHYSGVRGQRVNAGDKLDCKLNHSSCKTSTLEQE